MSHVRNHEMKSKFISTRLICVTSLVPLALYFTEGSTPKTTEFYKPMNIVAEGGFYPV